MPGTLLALLAAAIFISCAPTATPSGDEKVLTVAAAADLQFAFTELGRLFEQRAGARPTFIFSSSGTLASQIENGAAVDLFASADEEYVRRLASMGAVLQETEQLYGLGRMALVTFKGSGDLHLVRLEELLRPEVRHVALANPEHAPYGRAAREALARAGLWERLSPKVVYGENVRQALQFAQTGNAEAGIVALSIADTPEVGYEMVDESLYQPLRQSMVVVKGARHEQLARDFAAFVNGPEGRVVMKRYGFALPGER